MFSPPENILDSQIEFVFRMNILDLTVEYASFFFADLNQKSQPHPRVKQKHE